MSWYDTLLAKQISGGSVDPAAIAEAVSDWLEENVDPDTGYVIDDTFTVENAAPDSKKTGEELNSLKSAIDVLEPAATSADVGKTLVAKTVADGKVTEYEFGEAGGGVEIDDTLTQAGEAADAKAAGDAIAALDARFDTVDTKTDKILEFASKPRINSLTTNISDTNTSLQLFVGGKNLFAYPYFNASGRDHNGIIYTVDSDGTITANGTATADSSFTINYYAKPNWLPASTVIYVSGCTGGSASTYHIKYVQTGTMQTDSVAMWTIGSSASIMNFAIVVKSGTRMDNVQFKPMMALTNDAEYEKGGTVYTASVESGTTSHTWTGLTFRDGYNTIMPQNGDTLTVEYVRQINLADIDETAQSYANPWKGKLWAAFGTSITYTGTSNPDPNGDPTGKYPPYLMGMGQFVPFATTIGVSDKYKSNCLGVSGGCISGQILYYVRYYLHDISASEKRLDNAQLVTIEGAINDYMSDIPLGQVGDTVPYTNGSDQAHTYLPDATSEGSFAGACYCAFTEAQTYAPNAVVVLLTETTGKDHTGYANYSQGRKNSLGLTQMDYINMTIAVAKYVGIPVIECGADSMINAQNPQYLVDHIHHTYLGGYQYARTIWEKLKMIPNKALILPQ